MECLRQWSSEEFLNHIIQVVQIAKHEIYHDSPIVWLLLQRANQDPTLTGHELFWQLRGDMHVTSTSYRSLLLLEAYLRCCRVQWPIFAKQLNFLNSLKNIYSKLWDVPMAKRKELLQAELVQLNSAMFGRERAPSPLAAGAQQDYNASSANVLQLPLGPKFLVQRFEIAKCRCMDSAMSPIWMVMENADPCGDPIRAIFKKGDDLRQDALSLQVMGHIDRFWQNSNFDYFLSLYKVVVTGPLMGMIEVVENSETIANIQKAEGGISGAFKEKPLANWLRSVNKTEEDYQRAVQNFVLSVAGYCVATYVLGVGDRHNDSTLRSFAFSLL